MQAKFPLLENRAANGHPDFHGHQRVRPLLVHQGKALSQTLINKYLKELSNLKKVAGTQRESVVREAFKDMLKVWGRALDLTFIPEYELETKAKQRRYVDGALLHTLRVPFGYWEAKDTDDDLELEIRNKFLAGYPRTNIIFEDSQQAVLFQNGHEVMRCKVEEVAALERLLELFFGYERPEIEAFRNAVDQFKKDLPAVLAALREMISRSYDRQPEFRHAAAEFLTHAQEAINPNLHEEDVREMLIQHVLTGELFAAVFPGTTYHEDNSVARELHKLEGTFFTGNTKHQTLGSLAPYYAAIRKAATEIVTHHEKQTFLKAIYENFYKVYNKKAADRLGVVYTPNEIVRFMIDGADWLCERHFKRGLIDKGVDILDPATGTGTFICELIEHFGGQLQKLSHKYRWELHANEVAILPYYVANLNIEATYAASSGTYEEFPGLCFVDTLDNTFALRKHKGHMDDLFGGVSDDNVRRIRQQNSRRISVIIGNPPYNANQLNENENNKNREYPEIDKRIKETYVDASTAQKTKLYDMYARFFRWAGDRLDENGILAFVSNRSFIDSRTFDGFRGVVAREFNEIRIVDLGGDVRVNPKLSGTTHNVFGIQTGVAISFMVRAAKRKGCRIMYARRPEMELAREKLGFLSHTRLSDIEFEEVRPDKNNNWINLSETDFEKLIPLVNDDGTGKAIFGMRTNGVNTARDEWVYDLDDRILLRKAEEAVALFNENHARVQKMVEFERDALGGELKWSEALINKVQRSVAAEPSNGFLTTVEYRPFVSKRYYGDPMFSDRLTSKHFAIFGKRLGDKAPCLAISAPGAGRHFHVLATDHLADWHYLGDTQLYPEALSKDEDWVPNVTNWALERFTKHFKGGRRNERPITKGGIFRYVYAILHAPFYRAKYAIELGREFPRVPLIGTTSAHFWKWADWGSDLMDLHINYRKAKRHTLERVEKRDEKARKAGLPPKTILRADKAKGLITIDSETVLKDIPSEAWTYRLGARSAIDWILDQYKEPSSKDATIQEKFSNYRFADHKDEVVELVERIVTVSLETERITSQMKDQ